MKRLIKRAVSLNTANEFVERLHRHHKPVRGHKWSSGAFIDDNLVGVVIVGRPVARHLDDGKTVEALRLCTDGTKNICSFLYSAAARSAREIGYESIITYILETESGDSLKATGWTCEGEAGGGSWNCANRPRTDKAPTCKKTRWRKTL